MSLREAPRVPDRGRQRERGDMVQAGRSASLDAEKHAGELHWGISSPSTSPERKEQTDPPPLIRPRSEVNLSSRYTPAIPSPLNPSSRNVSRNPSTTSTSTSEEGHDVEKGFFSTTKSVSSRSKSHNKSTSSISSSQGNRRSGLTPAQQLLRQKSESAFRLSELSRPTTPKDVRDLGQDYSRYPPSASSSPSNSRSTSQVRPGPHAVQEPLLRTTTKNPFNDSQADLKKYGYPDDSMGSFNPYFGGERGFIMYPDEYEDDDYFHMPADDDDEKFKPKLKDYLEPRQLVSTLGATFLIIGLLCVFIVIPVVTFSTSIFGPKDDPRRHPGYVNDKKYELMRNMRKGLIDPDTPKRAMTRKSEFDGSTLKLVFSDEFNKDNRTFYPGDDPYWTAPNFWYGATQDLEWYDPDAVTTGGGTLQLKLDAFPNHGLQYRSGMLNSWNQTCFKGGVFEVSVSLAGPAGAPGLWPGAWTMGNLGRPGYLSTTDGVWPYTYDSCDVGITPNQSATDGTSYLPGQRLSKCTCPGDSHPSPGTGRGAPEIDILEGSVDPNNRIGVVTQSYQVAPFDVWYRPNYDFMAIPDLNISFMNTYCGGPFQQAVSTTSMLNNNWYGGQQYQKYAFEYIPGTSEGKIAWFVGDDPTLIMDGRAIGPNGNVAARHVSEEPMSMILNLGISKAWTWIDYDNLKFPTTMYVDYVRIYQKAGQEMMTCDPPGFPTTKYIADHPNAYRNPNFTVCCQKLYGGWLELMFCSTGRAQAMSGRRTHLQAAE